MPIYEYKRLGECPFCEERFEKFQNADEAPLAQCELCAIPIKRVISRPNMAVKGASQKGTPDAATLEKHGFARWEKRANGTYERTAGSEVQGPRILRKDGSTSD